MLRKSFGYLSLLAVSATCAALPDLPEPVTANSVASTTVRGKTYIVSTMGLAAAKQNSDIHNKVWMHVLGEFNWSGVAPVPSHQRLSGRLAASTVALNNNFFIFGGYVPAADQARQTSVDSYRLDPVTQRYTRLNDMPVAVNDAVAVTYQNRYIYLINGWSHDGSVNLVQLFDNYTQRWSQATPYPGNPAFGLAGAAIGNNIVVCDGATFSYSAGKPRQLTTNPQCYQGTIGSDAATIHWQNIPHPTGTARYRMSAIGTQVNGEDMIVFIGGSTSPYQHNGLAYDGKPAEPDGSVWVYAVKKQQWRKAEKTTPVMDARSLISINGDIYSVGGMLSQQQVTNKLIKHQIKLLPD